ncbi:DUF5131 family protein [Cupriavidus sp. WKF15]|uniref:DUF5131 family protein n=1 Tax=Cupriavidus sp. WKF15 TaxID=3032282 RepID=UPI0023E1ECFC|nr:DUF5131 family protein [Cupriavidus sp. WKF15]WER51005.1 DUF5131 family protein [Cupriavidus sp. WKF15]
MSHGTGACAIAKAAPADTPNLDWLLLTKRIGNAHAMLDAALADLSHGLTRWACAPWPNVWLGATICNQTEADHDIPKLLATPAAVRFLSMEPLLGSLTIRQHLMIGDHPGLCAACGKGRGFTRCPNHGGVAAARENCKGFVRADFAIDWVIAGGESGASARPRHPDWARSLRDQCAAAGVPFLFKQWGEWAPVKVWADSLPPKQAAGLGATRRVGKKAAGRLLDGSRASLVSTNDWRARPRPTLRRPRRCCMRLSPMPLAFELSTNHSSFYAT